MVSSRNHYQSRGCESGKLKICLGHPKFHVFDFSLRKRTARTCDCLLVERLTLVFAQYSLALACLKAKINGIRSPQPETFAPSNIEHVERPHAPTSKNACVLYLLVSAMRTTTSRICLWNITTVVNKFSTLLSISACVSMTRALDHYFFRALTRLYI